MYEFPDYPTWEEQNKKAIEWGDKWTVPIILSIVIFVQIIRVIAYYL